MPRISAAMFLVTVCLTPIFVYADTESSNVSADKACSTGDYTCDYPAQSTKHPGQQCMYGKKCQSSNDNASGICIATDTCKATQVKTSTGGEAAPKLPDTSVETNTGGGGQSGTPTVSPDTQNLTPDERINQAFQDVSSQPQSTGGITQQQLLQSVQGKSLLDQLLSPTPMEQQSGQQPSFGSQAFDSQYNLGGVTQLPSDISNSSFSQPFDNISNQDRVNAASTFAPVGNPYTTFAPNGDMISHNSDGTQTVTAAPGTTDQEWTSQLNTLAKNADSWGCSPSCFIVNDGQNKTAQLLSSSSGSFTGAAVMNVDPNAVGGMTWQSVITGKADQQAIADSLQKGVDVTMPNGSVQKYQFTSDTAALVAPAIATASNNDSSNIVGRAEAAWNGAPPVSVASANQIQVQSAEIVASQDVPQTPQLPPSDQAPPTHITVTPSDAPTPQVADNSSGAVAQLAPESPAPASTPQSDASQGNAGDSSAPAPQGSSQPQSGNPNAGGSSPSGTGPAYVGSSGNQSSSYSSNSNAVTSFIAGLLSGLGGAGSAPAQSSYVAYGSGVPVFVTPITLNLVLPQSQGNGYAQVNPNASGSGAPQNSSSSAPTILPYFVPPAGTTNPSSAYDPLTQLLKLAASNAAAPTNSSPAPSANSAPYTVSVAQNHTPLGGPVASVSPSAQPTTQPASQPRTIAPAPAQSGTAVSAGKSSTIAGQPGKAASPMGITGANANGVSDATPNTQPKSAPQGDVKGLSPSSSASEGSGTGGAGTGTGNGIGSGSQSGVQTFAQDETSQQARNCQTLSCWASQQAHNLTTALKNPGQALADLFSVTPANAQSYDPRSGQSLADAVNVACKVFQCNAPLLQRAFGGVCGIESSCDATQPHPGSQYQGFGQLGTRETYTAIRQLAQMQQSPNLSDADRQMLGQVIAAAAQMIQQGGNPNRNAVVGPWLLVGLHASLGTLQAVSAATNDPRLASTMLECAQFAPATCSRNFNLNSQLGPASAQAFNMQHLGWYYPGMTVGQASQQLYAAAFGKFNSGISFASQFTPGGTLAPIPTNYASAGNCAYRGCSATPTIEAGKPGYATGIERVAQCPNSLCYFDPQTGARGVPTDSNMTRDQFVRAAREDILLERMAQAGRLPQGAGFQNFIATREGPAPVDVNSQNGQTQIASELAAGTGISQPEAARAVAGNPRAAIDAVNAMSQGNADAVRKSLGALGLDPNLSVNRDAIQKVIAQNNNISLNGPKNPAYTIKNKNGDVVAQNVSLPGDAVGQDGSVRLLADKDGKPLGADGKTLGSGGQPITSANSTLPPGNLDPTNGQQLSFIDTRPPQPVSRQPLFSAGPIGYSGNNGSNGQQQYCLVSTEPIIGVPCNSIQPQQQLQPAQIAQPAQSYPQTAGQTPGIPIPPTPTPLPSPNTNPSTPITRPALAIIASPTVVASGTPSRISWSSAGTWSCSVYAPGKNLIGTTTHGSVLSPELSTTSTFTALCLTNGSSTISASTTVTVQ